ncbi:MAG: hypothetical protein AD742_07835 [Methylibium sp. NZG]|nr:MAG: hypothetical protein AD742_07835 [Methylibium sp. NZG]
MLLKYEGAVVPIDAMRMTDKTPQVALTSVADGREADVEIAWDAEIRRRLETLNGGDATVHSADGVHAVARKFCDR